MKDLVLRITKYDNPTNIIAIQDYCTEVKLSNSFTQIAAELNFTMPYATLSSSLVAINVELGDTVTLHYKDKQLFYGKVITIEKKGKEESMKVTCYDFCWWICKSNITKNFSNITILQALSDVYTEIGANYIIDKELGSNGDRILDSHLVKDKTASKVLQAIYSEITKQTGAYYYMHQDEHGLCTITEADKYYSNLTIKMPSSKNSADGNLINYEINESMENMITQVALYNEDGSKAKCGMNDQNEVVNTVILDSTDLSRFGIIQESITMDSEDDISKAKNEAKQLLEKKSILSEELSVTCLGDIDYRVAHVVMVKIPGTKYYDVFMYILSSEWIWNKDGTFISKLSLSPSKHHDLTGFRFKDIEEKQENELNSSESTGSDLVNRILEELKKHLGLPYKWGGKSPNEGGMDCSGYIAYVYNQFSNELEITSNDGKLTSYTYSMMNEGKDVTKDFPDNLKPCDIVFPHSGHVQAYIGDGKVIHEPQTGDVCKISDLDKNKIAKVIRVVPDSAWKSNFSTNADGNLNGAVNCTSQKEFAAMVAPYAKQLYSKYHIFPGTIISCMIQESWTGDGFTKLAKNYFNFGGVKCSSSSQYAVQDYKPPASEGSMLYRKFNSLKDFMNYWCELISGQTGMSVYKTNIADKNTPKEQIMGFNNTPYAGDKTKSQQMLAIYNQNNFSNYDKGL